MLYFNLLTLFLLCYPCMANKYCDISQNHTLCKFYGLGNKCINAGNGGVTQDEISFILKFHNTVRRRVARGHEKRGKQKGQPPAANMMKLEWDLELQTIAQVWADQCTYGHDERRVERWEVGQNIYVSSKGQGRSHWNNALEKWYHQINKFDANIISNYKFHYKTSQYSQMAWGNTYRIGCGVRSWGVNRLYVCDYGPIGNIPFTAMYTIGKDCTKCPNNTFCEYGLCAYRKSFLRADVIDTESPEALK